MFGLGSLGGMIYLVYSLDVMASPRGVDFTMTLIFLPLALFAAYFLDDENDGISPRSYIAAFCVLTFGVILSSNLYPAARNFTNAGLWYDYKLFGNKVEFVESEDSVFVTTIPGFRIYPNGKIEYPVKRVYEKKSMPETTRTHPDWNREFKIPVSMISYNKVEEGGTVKILERYQ